MRRKIILFLCMFAVIALVSLLSNQYFHRSICIFWNVIGIPCPSCGMTRAYMALFHGDLNKAFFYHPLFWLVPFLVLAPLYSKKWFFFICGIFVVVWLYRMYIHFPFQEPLIFNQNALYIRFYRYLYEILHDAWFMRT